MKEKHEVKISIYTENRMLKIRISGITSGFVTHTSDDDNSIVFQLDKSRFYLVVKLGDRTIFDNS